MEGNVCKMVRILIYVVMSAMGLILIKLGTGKEFSLSISLSSIDFKINWIILVGVLLYVCSFVLSLVIMKNMDLSIFYPVATGLIYVLVCVASYFVLKESISARQFIGMGIILAGIVAVNTR